MINHAPSGTRVEWYTLNVETGEAKLESYIQDPTNLPAPNSLAAVSGSEVFITNDHLMPVRANPILGKIETYGGIPGGSVTYLQLGEDGTSSVTTLVRIPFANGVVMLNDTTLAVASSSTASVRLFKINHSSETGSPELVQRSSIWVPFVPDNISLDSKGKLLITGHPHPPSLEKVARHNRFCEDPATASTETCDLPKLSWVAEWSEQEGLKTLYAGSDYGTSTTAVRDWTAGIGIVTGLYERGILTWQV